MNRKFRKLIVLPQKDFAHLVLFKVGAYVNGTDTFGRFTISPELKLFELSTVGKYKKRDSPEFSPSLSFLNSFASKSSELSSCPDLFCF
ncbi:MAG TPA: hypothetical protein VLL54_16535 [Pyrinomonadaceae bacterium]|nr:hypothetical protein [Pyrinomonadaceae bacterium]